jgi:choline dehydrogenase
MRSALATPEDPPDLNLFTSGPYDDAAIPSGAVFGIVVELMSPRSRGSLRLRSADPADPPRIDSAFLRHPDDLARMVDATRAARRISRTPPLADLVRYNPRRIQAGLGGLSPDEYEDAYHRAQRDPHR